MDFDREFRMRLEMQYEIIEMDGDGNCLFAALATHIYGTHAKQRDVRLKIYNEIVCNQEEYQAFMIQFNNNERPLETLSDILTDGSWGGDLSLGAVQRAFDLNVILHQPDQIDRNMPPTLTHSNTVHLSYHGNNHYNLLRQREQNRLPIPSFINMDIDDEKHEISEVEILQEYVGNFSQPTNTRGLHSLARNFYYSGRDEIAIVMLVPIYTARKTLTETLVEGKPNHVFIGLHYANQLSDIVRDVDIPKIYDIYACTLTLPMGIRIDKRSTWLAKILIVHVILGASHLVWNGIQLRFWFNHNPQALPSMLIINVWKEVRREVMRDVSIIINNPDLFMCTSCSPQCVNAYKQWHIDLKMMKRAVVEDAATSLFFERHTLEDPISLSRMMTAVRNLYKSKTKGDPGKLAKIFDKFSDSEAQIGWSSYLVVIMDAEHMQEADGNGVEQLISNPSVWKALYAGHCIGERFRTSHFGWDGSRIHQVLTGTSRMFFIRQTSHKTKIAAAEDEAIIIELIQLYLKIKREDTKSAPFVFLNLASSQNNLLHLPMQTQEQIRGFCNSSIPIFNSHVGLDKLAYYEWDFFPGNYTVHEEICFPVNAYQHKTFADVKHIYEK